MMFYSSPEPIFEEARDAEVIITPHRFTQRLLDVNAERLGTYNVSWLTFRSGKNGTACLDWYRRRCLEWCLDIPEEDRFADQKYLDYFSQLFPGVHSIRHEGAGLAPWNITDASFLKLHPEKIIFYHAHGFKKILWIFYSSGFLGYYARVKRMHRDTILYPYIKEYKKAQKKIRSIGMQASNHGIRNKINISTTVLLKRIWEERKKKTLLIYI